MAFSRETSRYNERKYEPESIKEEKAKRLWIKSRLEYSENDEKSTRFLFSKSKGKYEQNLVARMTK